MALVPCTGSDRRETATLLLAMAREKGLATSVIRSVYNGYEVPDELLGIEDAVVLDVKPEPVPVVQRADAHEFLPDAPKQIVVEAAPRRGRPKAVVKTED